MWRLNVSSLDSALEIITTRMVRRREAGSATENRDMLCWGWEGAVGTTSLRALAEIGDEAHDSESAISDAVVRLMILQSLVACNHIL